MGTFVAILLGTIAGGLMVAVAGDGPVLAGARRRRASRSPATLVSRAIPHTPAVDPGLAINWNPFSETWKNLRFAQGNRVVWLSMLGISWFWFYGATFLAQFAGYSRGRARRRRARRHVSARALLGRHRHRLAAVRAAVRPQGRARPRAVRLDRADAVRASICGSRAATCARTGWPGSTCSSRAARTGAWPPISC